MLENMYLNVYPYQTISGDAGAIARMVAFSAVTATLATLLFGALSDRLGRRKPFIAGGYLLWGLAVIAAGLITMSGNLILTALLPLIFVLIPWHMLRRGEKGVKP